MVIALLALFVALGGSSYAAVKLAKNSVLSKHIKNGQVKRADLGSASVDSSKVANGALRSEDFAPGQVPAGERGAPGEPGTPGANGANGAALAARARCNGCPKSSAAANVPQNVPLTNAQWTQGANDGNQFFVEADWTGPPSTCSSNLATLRVMLDGEEIAQFQRSGFGTGVSEIDTKTVYRYGSGTADQHALTASITDDCPGSENASVEALRIDVARFLG